jgi:hypothetical protein
MAFSSGRVVASSGDLLSGGGGAGAQDIGCNAHRNGLRVLAKSGVADGATDARDGPGAWPRPASRDRKRAHFVADPISPQAAKPWPAACGTGPGPARGNRSGSDARPLAVHGPPSLRHRRWAAPSRPGQGVGKAVAATSIQVIAMSGKGASTATSARPTWPAPQIQTCRRGRRAAPPASPAPAQSAGAVPCARARSSIRRTASGMSHPRSRRGPPRHRAARAGRARKPRSPA